ncbi:unnamed protein product [Boreogadus saida]
MKIIRLPVLRLMKPGESRPGYTAGGQQPATNPDLPRAAIGRTRNTWAGSARRTKGGDGPRGEAESSGRQDDNEEADSVE